MKVSIRRESGLVDYQVPPEILKSEPTVMQILEYIRAELDPSLAYYRHSVCNHGICLGCIIKVNGRNVLACVRKVVPEETELLLEPANDRVVRDLVVEL